MLNNETVVHQITTTLLAIIRKQHPCQQDMGDDEDLETLQETSEYDWLVIDTAMDVITSMAVALGPTFGELWKTFEKTILKYAGSTEHVERSTSVGVIAEAIGGMGEAITPFTTVRQLLPPPRPASNAFSGRRFSSFCSTGSVTKMPRPSPTRPMPPACCAKTLAMQPRSYELIRLSSPSSSRCSTSRNHG